MPGFLGGGFSTLFFTVLAGLLPFLAPCEHPFVPAYAYDLAGCTFLKIGTDNPNPYYSGTLLRQSSITAATSLR